MPKPEFAVEYEPEETTTHAQLVSATEDLDELRIAVARMGAAARTAIAQVSALGEVLSNPPWADGEEPTP